MARMKFPRLAVRAIVLRDQRLLLVNAYPGQRSDLWCAPGGGVMANQSLPDNLKREVREELGLEIRVRELLGVNEFHTADGSFHQVDLFFRANPLGDVAEGWMDSEGVVNRHLWVNRAEATDLRIKPDSLIRMAFEGGAGALYDPLEMIVS